MNSDVKNSRILYIDALRGFTMILVVYHHVILKCFKQASLMDSALQSFRMPVFFFVSGFVAYKALDFWNAHNTGKRLISKFKAQVIPTLAFYSLYYYFIIGCQPILLLYQVGFRQFWFTIVLFEFFIIYFSINYLTHKCRKCNVLFLLLIAIVSVMFFQCASKKANINIWLDTYHLSYYLPFFISGTFVRKYISNITKVLDKKWFLSLFVMLFIAQLVVYTDIYYIPQSIKNFITYWSIRITGLIMVFTLFVRLRNVFSVEGIITKTLTFIGRRTLDIYFLHFFFITRLSELHFFINDMGWSVAERPILICVTGMIVVMCLLVSSLIRQSKFLGKLLFAAKY